MTNETQIEAGMLGEFQHFGPEQGRSPRVPLHWTVYLACTGSQHRLRATTRNISSDGFYCVLDQPLKLGDRIDCDIVVPTHLSRNPNEVAYLRCRALVACVEDLGVGAGFGVACEIEDFHLIHGAAAR